MFDANGKIISCYESISLSKSDIDSISIRLNGPAKQRFNSFMDLSREIVKSGYEALSIYERSLSKIKVKCPKGHIYEVRPASFKLGSRCTVCSGNSKSNAELSFRKNAESRGYIVIGEYKSNRIKVKAKCPKGHACELTPVDFNKGSGCRHCGPSPEGSKDRFETAAKKLGFELLEDYKGNTTKVKARCSEGHEVMLIPSSIKAGRGCKDCANMSQKGGVSMKTLISDKEYMSEDCFLYVSEISTANRNLYKIGISINGHRTKNKIADSKLSCILLRKTSRLKAYLSEQLTLSSLKENRIFVSQYKDNGGTEFFSINPSKTANDILTYINSISDTDAIAILKDLEG